MVNLREVSGIGREGARDYMREYEGDNQKESAVDAPYLTPHALYKRWGNAISPKTLANWRTKGIGPKWTKIGGRVVYALADVLEYERSRAMLASAVLDTAERCSSSIRNA